MKKKSENYYSKTVNNLPLSLNPQWSCNPPVTLFTIRVPNGLAPEDGGSDENVYFHAKQVDSASSKYLRLVEC